MNCFVRVFILLCLFLECGALAGEVKILKIESLAEVLVEVKSLLENHSSEKMVFLSDWDEFLTSHNGGNSPREANTVKVLGEISSLIRVGILTARGAGGAEFSSTAAQVTHSMHLGLFNLTPKQENPLTVNPAFNAGPFEFRGATIEKKVCEDQTPTSPNRIVLSEKDFWTKFPPSPLKMPREPGKTHPVFVLANNIAFAGNPLFDQMINASLKGIAATALLDGGYFKGERPSVILFGDNDLENIEAMARSFQERSEK